MEKLFVTFSLLSAVALSAAISQDVTKLVPSKTVKQQPKPAPKPKVNPTPVFSAEPKVLAVVDLDTLPKKKKEVKVEHSESHEVITNTSVNANNEVHTKLNINSDGVNTYRINSNGKDYDLVKVNGEIRALMIDGKEIPKEQYLNYQKEINEVLDKVKQEHEKAEVHRKHADTKRDEANKQRAHADEQRIEADNQRESADNQRQEAEKQRRHAEKSRADADKDRIKYEGMQEGMINDLIESGVIKSKDNLSYKLSEDALIVNGEKQPAALHEKLKTKYVKDKNVEMIYNYSTRPGSTSTGFIYKN